MATYPLFRTKLSNERLMTALLFVLLLYNLPRLMSDPGSLLGLLLLVAEGLVLDAAAHFLIYKRPVCAVSGGVTALMLYTLTPGAPLGGVCLALAAALLLGKHVWGGTGRNPLNPAMLGMALLAFFVSFAYPPFEATLWLLPAAILSVPFLFVRPYAGIGMMLGMALSLLLSGDLSPQALLAWGVPLWGCLVITDPVTMTARPVPGLIIGLLAGFVPMATGSTPAALPLGVLLANLLSYRAEGLNPGKAERLRKTFGRRQKIRFSPTQTAFVDLSDEHPEAAGEASDAAPDTALDRDTILKRLEKHNITGCGGAAFPTVKKLRAVLETTLPGKHLIVNAAECDPGLIHDKWLLKNKPDELLGGIGLLRACVPFRTVTVAAKDFYGAAFPAAVRQHKVPDYYPAGAEKILIKDALKIELQPNEIPSECGILVLNAQTVISLNDAVRRARAADVRYITVADLDNRTGTVARVRLGDRIHDTVHRIYPSAVNVYAGGGAMSAHPADDGAVIDERTNFLAVGAVKGFREAVCSRCGACSAYCPASLPVRDIARLIDEGAYEKAARLHPENCINCNLCSAVCPAGRDQARRMREAGKLKK